MVIIDGHNLLWAVWGAREGPERISDLQLCRLVGWYLAQIGETGEIVFDGPGPRDKSDFGAIEGVEVLFSGFRTDADTVIGDKIKASTAPRRLTVVSSDRRLRKAARARRAIAVKSEVFWSQVQKESRRSSKASREDEPAGKEKGLTESETEHWLEFFHMGDGSGQL